MRFQLFAAPAATFIRMPSMPFGKCAGTVSPSVVMA